MTPRRHLQLDVFAARPGDGNPLGVVVDAAGLDDTSMQAFAAWANLSETIFFLPPPADAPHAYRIRIFTPRQELPFAGHPSVGAGWAAIELGLATPDAGGGLVQHCAAGALPVRIDRRADGTRGVRVRAPRARALDDAAIDAGAIASACADLRVAGCARRWNNGPTWWTLPLADGAAVRGATPDLAPIAALTLATDAVGFAVYAAASDDDHDLVVRAFCPADQIPEDPVTGSVNACIAARLAQEGALPGRDGRYVASQGRELGRDGRIDVHVDGDGEVWIGGRVQPVVDGTLRWR